MFKKDFDFSNCILGLKLIRTNDERIILKIHSGDDEYYNDKPFYECEAGWIPEIIRLLLKADHSLPKNHPRIGGPLKTIK